MGQRKMEPRSNEKSFQNRGGKTVIQIELPDPYPQLLKQEAEANLRSLKRQTEYIIKMYYQAHPLIAEHSES